MQVTPGRVAAITAALAALVSGVVIPVLGAVPETQRAAVLIAAIVVVGALGVVFLIGAQRHEARQGALEQSAADVADDLHHLDGPEPLPKAEPPEEAVT